MLNKSKKDNMYLEIILAAILVIAVLTIIVVDRSAENLYVPNWMRWISAIVIGTLTYLSGKWRK